MSTPLINLKLSDGTYRALLRAHVLTVDELQGMAAKYLLEMHGIGRKRLREIQDALARGSFTYCQHCNRDVIAAGERCPECSRLLWQKMATDPHDFKHKTRTTMDTYAAPSIVDAMNQLERIKAGRK